MRFDPGCCCAGCDTSITVTIKKGLAAQSGVTVTLKQGTTTVATGTTNASGVYKFASLVAGTYQVSAVVDGVHHLHAEEDLAECEAAAVNWLLGWATFTYTTCGSCATAGALITVTGTSGPAVGFTGSGTTGADGKLTITGMPTGSFSVPAGYSYTAVLSPYVNRSGTFSLSSSATVTVTIPSAGIPDANVRYCCCDCADEFPPSVDVTLGSSTKFGSAAGTTVTCSHTGAGFYDSGTFPISGATNASDGLPNPDINCARVQASVGCAALNTQASFDQFISDPPEDCATIGGTFNGRVEDPSGLALSGSTHCPVAFSRTGISTPAISFAVAE